MTTRHRYRASAIILLSTSALGGCQVGTRTAHGPTVITTTTETARPHPTKTVIHNYRTYAAGQIGALRSPSQRASLSIAVSKPSLSTTRLSPKYGDAPANGHYVTFVITVKNNGQVPVLLRRLDFWVRTPGARKTTTDDGNAPFSGSGTQLDTTELVPGKSVTNNLTFDVSHPTGSLFYAPDGVKSLAWTF